MAAIIRNKLPNNHPIRGGMVSFVPRPASTQKDSSIKFLGILTPAEAEVACLPSRVLVISPLESAALELNNTLRTSGCKVTVESELSEGDPEYLVIFPPNRSHSDEC
jgi:hypothetical protein